jgi:hypothetical protein
MAETHSPDVAVDHAQVLLHDHAMRENNSITKSGWS